MKLRQKFVNFHNLAKTFYEYRISSYSFLPWILSSLGHFPRQNISLLSKKLKYCCNYLNFPQFPNSKKNSFLGNCMRKYSIWFLKNHGFAFLLLHQIVYAVLLHTSSYIFRFSRSIEWKYTNSNLKLNFFHCIENIDFILYL